MLNGALGGGDAITSSNATDVAGIRMPNPHVMWRIGSGQCALLLTTIFSAMVSSKSAHSTLTYDNGKEYETNFFDAHLLGELPVVDKNGPILVFAGRPDLPCAPPICDAETDVYFQLATEPPDGWSSRPLRYPGNYYAKESGKLVATVRMFIGQCIDSREGVVWIVHNAENPAPQINSPLASQVVFEVVNGSFLSTEWADNQDISAAQAAVASPACKEVPPGPRIYRSSAAYLAPKMPDIGIAFRKHAQSTCETMDEICGYDATRSWPSDCVFFSAGV
jgi:hypothetical protein